MSRETMSLKAFHIFFVSVSILIMIGFGIWAIGHRGGLENLWMGIGAFAMTAILVFYLRWFRKKARKALLAESTQQ